LLLSLKNKGIDFKIKIIEVEGKRIKMQIWDTAGQDRFKTITQTYYKGAMGILMTYSVNDANSFNNIKNWMNQIKEHAAENVCVMLVGNKCDSTERKVDASQGKKLADDYGIPFIETSARDNININACFERIGKEIKDKILVNEEVPDDNGIRLNAEPTPVQPAGGCRC
jgi:Ras-related protein Rab-8A